MKEHRGGVQSCRLGGAASLETDRLSARQRATAAALWRAGAGVGAGVCWPAGKG